MTPFARPRRSGAGCPSGAKRRWLPALLAFAVLASCGGGGPAATNAGVGDDSAVSPIVFDVGYERIADVYLEPVDLGALVIEGLGGLSEIDEAVSVRRSGGAVWVFASDRRLGGLNEPTVSNTDGWARLTVEAIGLMRAASPSLQAAEAETLYTTVFDAVLEELDGYSRYVDSARAERERAARDGYGGIGILLGFNEEIGRGFVEEVFPETPASRARVEAGELFVAVDGMPTLGWDLETLSENLRGPADSVVAITLQRQSDSRTRTLRLRREHVIINAVSVRLDGDIAVLRVRPRRSISARRSTAAWPRSAPRRGD